jgi:hypothetical protein
MTKLWARVVLTTPLKFVSKLSSTKAAKQNICSLTQLGLRIYKQLLLDLGGRGYTTRFPNSETYMRKSNKSERKMTRQGPG